MDGRNDQPGAGPTEPTLDPRLRRGVLDTEVQRGLAWLLVGAFLLVIYAVPLSQALLERLDDEESSLLPLFTRPPSKENLHQLEHDLEEASFAKAFVQPRVQLWLSRLGREGNKRALVGLRGFLYYTPGLTHVAGPSFLDPNVISSRERAAREADPPEPLRADPRPAIFDFQRMLARRGVTLLLFPVPDKVMLQPRELHGRGASAAQLTVSNNPGWSRLAAELRAHGIAVFDPSPTWLAHDEPARFLIQDTHWTPVWMTRVASELATVVTQVGHLRPQPNHTPLHRVVKHIERVGDLVDMLQLPDDQHWFRPQAVTVQQVQDATGAPWQPDPAADVLLLGDSFTNVFSLDTMGWGESAGLAPQLALALGRNVDVIARNDAGAHATRLELARALAAGEDRLAGKRVVIWEFAARELSVGDWQLIDWHTGREVGVTP